MRFNTGRKLKLVLFFCAIVHKTVLPVAEASDTKRSSDDTALSGYSVIFDAGSTGTRVHVYRYNTSVTAPGFPDVELPGLEEDVNPGLSFYAPRGEGVAKSIKPLVRFAQEQVPASLHSRTPIHLFATAGVRLLPRDQATAVLDAVRDVFHESGFLFHPEWVRVLTGQQEGLLAWLAFNYAAGTLQAALMDTTDSGVGSKASHIKHQAFLPPSGTTWGVLELGGASMQVTFMQPQGLDMPNKDGKGKKGGSSGSRHDATIAFPGAHRNLSLYTHSFLGYGVAVAFDNMTRTAEKAGSNPCMPTGFKGIGTATSRGNFSKCVTLIQKMMPSSSCKHKQCSIGGAYLPPVAGVFLGTENFYYTAKRLGLPTGVTSSPSSVTFTQIKSDSSDDGSSSTSSPADGVERVSSTKKRGKPKRKGSSRSGRQMLSGAAYDGDGQHGRDLGDSIILDFMHGLSSMVPEYEAARGQSRALLSLAERSKRRKRRKVKHLSTPIIAAGTTAAPFPDRNSRSYFVDPEHTEYGTRSSSGDDGPLASGSQTVQVPDGSAQVHGKRIVKRLGGVPGSAIATARSMAVTSSSPAPSVISSPTQDTSVDPGNTAISSGMADESSLLPGGMLVSLQDIEKSGSQLCSRDWHDIEKDLVVNKGHATAYASQTCFMAAYMWVVIKAALQLDDSDHRFILSNSIKALPDGQPTEVNWVLGALLTEVIGQESELLDTLQDDQGDIDQLPATWYGSVKPYVLPMSGTIAERPSAMTVFILLLFAISLISAMYWVAVKSGYLSILFSYSKLGQYEAVDTSYDLETAQLSSMKSHRPPSVNGSNNKGRRISLDDDEDQFLVSSVSSTTSVQAKYRVSASGRGSGSIQPAPSVGVVASNAVPVRRSGSQVALANVSSELVRPSGGLQAPVSSRFTPARNSSHQLLELPLTASSRF